jgi:hypothetical protein
MTWLRILQPEPALLPPALRAEFGKSSRSQRRDARASFMPRACAMRVDAQNDFHGANPASCLLYDHPSTIKAPLICAVGKGGSGPPRCRVPQEPALDAIVCRSQIPAPGLRDAGGLRTRVLRITRSHENFITALCRAFSARWKAHLHHVRTRVARTGICAHGFASLPEQSRALLINTL